MCDLLRCPFSIHFVAGVCLSLYSRRCDLVHGLNVGFYTRTPFTTVRPIITSCHALQSYSVNAPTKRRRRGRRPCLRDEKDARDDRDAHHCSDDHVAPRPIYNSERHVGGRTSNEERNTSFPLSPTAPATKAMTITALTHVVRTAPEPTKSPPLRRQPRAARARQKHAQRESSASIDEPIDTTVVL